MVISKKITNGVIVFSALLSIYGALKGSPELISLIKAIGNGSREVL